MVVFRDDEEGVPAPTKGSHLIRLGLSNPIEVKFEGLEMTFILCPRVVKDLHADFNVSKLFLKGSTPTWHFP